MCRARNSSIRSAHTIFSSGGNHHEESIILTLRTLALGNFDRNSACGDRYFPQVHQADLYSRLGNGCSRRFGDFAATSGTSSKTLQSGDALAGQFVLTADADPLWVELSGKGTATLYGKPTSPTVADYNEYAPHMASVLRLDTQAGSSAVSGCNVLSATFTTESGESFTRFRPVATNVSDPCAWLTLPSDTAKTEEYGYLLMKIRLSEGAPLKGQIYFITDECSIAEPASVHYNYEDTTDWQYVIVHLGSNAYYKGMLQQLRFDVFPSVEGMCHADVAYMALFRTKEGAEAFHDKFEDFEEDTTMPVEPTPDYSTMTVSIERFVDGKWEFETVGEAEFALCENGLMLSVDKTLIGGSAGEAMSFTFKWADHADVRGDVMRFMELGDAAPNDRFAFAYNANGVADE